MTFKRSTHTKKEGKWKANIFYSLKPHDHEERGWLTIFQSLQLTIQFWHNVLHIFEYSAQGGKFRAFAFLLESTSMDHRIVFSFFPFHQNGETGFMTLFFSFSFTHLFPSLVTFSWKPSFETWLSLHFKKELKWFLKLRTEIHPYTGSKQKGVWVTCIGPCAGDILMKMFQRKGMVKTPCV